MILAARRSTVVVVAAVLHTLVAPFSANEVGQCQGVLGDIGLEAITADAAVLKSFLYLRLDIRQI